MQRANRAPGQSQPAYYVFNAQACEGYVIVAGDDRVPAILGYSDNGAFNPTDIPEAMQELLDGYAASDEQRAASDLTGDGQVDIADINAVINIMLGKAVAGRK